MRVFNTFINKLNNIKIKKKLIITYIIAVIVPVLIVGIILTYGMRKMALNSTIKETTANIERIQIRLEEIFRIAVNIASEISLDEDVHEILSTQYQSTWEVVKTYWNYDDIRKYLYFYPQIKSIRIYSKNITLLENWEFMKVTSKTESLKWYQKAYDDEGKFIWDYAYDEIKDEYFLSLIKVIKNFDGKSLGVLIIELNKDYLQSVFYQEPFETFISTDGRIVAAKSGELTGKYGYMLGIKTDQKEWDAKILDIDYNLHPHKLIIKTFCPENSISSFQIVSVIPVENIVKDANEILLLGAQIITINLVLALVLIIIFSNGISKRIRILSQEMHKVVSGDFNTYSTVEGKDEIGQLSADLNHIIRSIKKLIYEVYEANLQKKQLDIKQKEIEFKMLASQINPHFLYNALETIRMKAHSRGENEIARIVKMFGIIMRKNLEVTNKAVPLEDEINLVRSYLEIQKFRFNDRMTYQINIHINIENYTILPLLLQPVVENAFVHGLENKKGNGEIIIDVKELDNCLVITVLDNGLGMTQSRLISILGSMNNRNEMNTKHIGLANVHQRIKLYYGEQYGIRIESALNEGTKVEIILPQKSEGGGLYVKSIIS
ncbi:MAG: two-component system, sensor histidine kinase YesM [Petroclostridium sp.]|jgi:two-component system sensor histidine kinase YesM|nr:two-component system, sensor histidine kinase YesM [Petroclostridium sp.]